MTTIRSGTYVPPDYVARTTRTIENQIGKVGDAVTSTIGAGVSIAVDAVTSTAKVGVGVVGSIIDCWI